MKIITPKPPEKQTPKGGQAKRPAPSDTDSSDSGDDGGKARKKVKKSMPNDKMIAEILSIGQAALQAIENKKKRDTEQRQLATLEIEAETLQDTVAAHKLKLDELELARIPTAPVLTKWCEADTTLRDAHRRVAEQKKVNEAQRARFEAHQKKNEELIENLEKTLSIASERLAFDL